MKQKFKIKILLVIIAIVQLVAVMQWIHCSNFLDQFHLSSLDLNLRLIEGIHNDTTIPLWQVRLFHNKLTGSVFDIFGIYVQFWDFAFLASFISLAGVIGPGAQFYYFFFKKKLNLLVGLLFLYLPFAPLGEIFYPRSIPFLIRFVFIVLPFFCWSLLGYSNMLKEKNVNTKIIDLILIISLWYLFFPPTAMFCMLK